MRVFRICAPSSVSALRSLLDFPYKFANLRFLSHFHAAQRWTFRGDATRFGVQIASFQKVRDDAEKINADSGASLAMASQKSSTQMAIGMALFAFVVGGAGVWFVQQRERSADAAPTRESSSGPKYVVHLEGFTVNLADPEETHFLRTTMDLGIDGLPDGGQKDKAALALPIPRIRDAILSVLTVCKANDLLTPEGKAQLKKNLIDAVNRSVPEIGVREIYFTEFLIQR
jgi:flagellar protein FliL